MLNYNGENVDKLCTDNYKLLPYFVKKYCSEYSNDEIWEIIDYCLTVYIKCCIKYNSDLNIKFSTYVGRAIKNRIAEYFTRYKYRPQNNCVSLDQLISTEFENVTLLETIENKKCEYSFLLENVYNYINEHFEERDRMIFINYIEGSSQAKIAEKYNVTQAQISRIINRIRKELSNNCISSIKGRFD